MQLFSAKSIAALLGRAGYRDVKIRPFANRYAISYWARLMPASPKIKRLLVRALTFLGLSRIKMSLNVGNMIAVGFRPERAAGPFE